MKPRPTITADLEYWADYKPSPTIVGGPPSEPDCLPCPALLTHASDRPEQLIVRVAYEMTDVEREQIANGGTIWLSTWGGLPIHMLEVQAP